MEWQFPIWKTMMIHNTLVSILQQVSELYLEIHLYTRTEHYTRSVDSIPEVPLV